MCVYNYISFRQAWPEKIKINKDRNINVGQTGDTILMTKQKQIHKETGIALLMRNFTESPNIASI